MKISCHLHLLRSTSSTIVAPSRREISGTFGQGRHFEKFVSSPAVSEAAATTRTGSCSSSMSLPALSSLSSKQHRSLSSVSSSFSLLISQHLLSPSSASRSLSLLSTSTSATPLRCLHMLVDPDGRSSRGRRRNRGASESLGSDDAHPTDRCSVRTYCHIAKLKKGSLASSLPSGDSATAPVRSLITSGSGLSSSVSSPIPEPEAADNCATWLAPTAAYVHLPFCRRRCFYCDFPILAVGERTKQTEGHIDSFMSDYVDLVCREIAKTGERAPKPAAGPLRSVFFGGGTPSLVPVPLLARIIDELKRNFQIASDAEISMEMDPGTFDRAKLAGFLESGVTRVSLGVQSFQAELLQACGRAHGVQEIYDAIDAIHWNGLKNWSLDLMASLPNQTLKQWEHSLEEVVSLRPAHVSVYDLQIEEGTLFDRWFKVGQEPLPSEDNSAELYSTASRRLREAGYEHYEVSNYAMPGFQSRHNLVYWENGPYYAFGLGSTSYVNGRRFSRPRKLKEYAAYVHNLEASEPDTSAEFLEFSSTTQDQILDTVMLSLRLASGLDIAEFEAKFGLSLTATLCNALVPFVEKGFVEAADAQRQRIPSRMYIQSWKDAKGDVSKLWNHTAATRGLTCSNHSNGSLVESCVEVNDADRVIETRGALQKCDGSSQRAVFVRLTDPEGFLLSNEVISSVFAALPSGGSV